MLAFYSRQLLIYSRKRGEFPFPFAGGNQDHRLLQPMVGSVENEREERNEFYERTLFLDLYTKPLTRTKHLGARA